MDGNTLTSDEVSKLLRESGFDVSPSTNNGVASVVVGDSGNVQIQFKYGDKIAAVTMSQAQFKGAQTDIKNVVINGTGGDANGIAWRMENQIMLENSDNYNITYQSNGAYSSKELHNLISSFESSFKISTPEYSFIGGASAAINNNGTKPSNVVNEAITAMNNGGKFDIGIYDAASNAEGFEFLSDDEDVTALRKYMRENGGILYAYEATKFGEPAKALDEYVVIAAGADDGPNNVIFAVNSKLKNHSVTKGDIKNLAVSPEYISADNTLNNMANGHFEDTSITYVVSNGQDDVEEESETRFYNLNSTEFQEGRYIYNAEDDDIYLAEVNPDGTKKYVLDENGNRISLALNVDELNDYISNTRQFSIGHTFIEGTLQLQEIKFLNTKVYQNQGESAGKMAVTYNNVAALTNSIVYAANATRCKDQPISTFGSSNAEFLNSLNKAHSNMFGITGQLMDTLSRDINNIAQILENYKNLETSLLSDAEKLTFANLGIAPTAGLDINKIFSSNTSKTNSGYYDTTIVPGGAGKFSLDNLDYLLSGDSTLTRGLINEKEDASALKRTIENMMNSPYAIGDGWDEVYKHLEDYVTICNYRIEAADALMNAEKRAFELIKNYMVNTPPPLDCDVDEYDRTYIDDSEIVEVEEHMKKLNTDIKNAEAKKRMLEIENAGLSKIRFKSWQECHSDAKGNLYYTYHDNAAEYNAAQARIASNNARIADLEVQLDLARHTLEIATQQLNKLNGLAGKINEANGMIADALSVVNSKYGALVESMPNIVVEPLTF